MATTRLSVSWTAYQKNICNGFGLLQQRGEFVDMTVAADGHHVQVHKIVMSLVSPYIKDLITATQCPHPVIFLNNVSQATLEHLLEYIYTGEVLVPTEHIKEFLQAGKSLHIKGLEKLSTVHLHRETEESLKLNTVPEPVDQQTTEIEDNDDICNNESTFIETTVINDNDDTDMEMDTSQVNISSKNTDIQPKNTKASSQVLQYTITNQGNLQVVLNRYLYSFHYHRMRTDDYVWRCLENRKRCPATLITRNGKVFKRLKPHNHSYHDIQILKRIRKGLIYSELGEAQNMANNSRKTKKDFSIDETNNKTEKEERKKKINEDDSDDSH